MQAIILMRNKIFQSIGLSLFFITNLLAQNQFYHKLHYTGWLWKEAEISYIVNKQEVGFIYYIQIPLHYYIIHSFYIIPKYRKRGHGTALLTYVCNFLQQQQDAYCIFVQPGPFALYRKLPKNHLYYKQLEKLVSLYERLGFKHISLLLSQVTAFLYWILGIDEDAQYLLMLKNT